MELRTSVEDGSGLRANRTSCLLVQARPERLEIHWDQDRNEQKPVELL